MLRVELSIHRPHMRMYTTRPSVEIEVEPPAIAIERQPPELNIKSEPPWVRADIDGALAEMGYRDAGTYARHHVQKARTAALEAIARTAAEGDRLAAIESGGDVSLVIAQAVGDYWASQQPELNVALVPRKLLPVEAGGFVEIEVTPEALSIEAEPGRVGVRLDPGEIRIEVDGWPQVSMSVVGERYSAWA